MNNKRRPGLFVAGTDTGVGKTHVAAMVVRSLRAAGRSVGVYKPAASGCLSAVDGSLISDDAQTLWEAAGRPGSLDAVCPQRFAAPLAPHLAAEAEGRTLDAELLRRGLDAWLDYDVVVVEGAGGLFSPLGRDELNIDLAAELGLPLVLVAANRLGTIHATLATLIAAAARAPQLCIAGVVLNDAAPDDGRDASRRTNAAELRRLIRVPFLAEVAHAAATFTPAVDWPKLAALG